MIITQASATKPMVMVKRGWSNGDLTARLLVMKGVLTIRW